MGMEDFDKNEVEIVEDNINKLDTDSMDETQKDAYIKERQLGSKLAWEEAATKYSKRFTPTKEQMKERMEKENNYIASIKSSAALSEDEINSELERLYPKK